MEEQTFKPFWAIIELFGHTKLAGQVNKHPIADFLQINIPEVSSVPAWTKILNPKAIYGLNPCSEETARQSAEAIKAMPISEWDVKTAANKLIDSLQEQGKLQLIQPQQSDYEDDPEW